MVVIQHSYKPHPAQLQIHQSKARFKVLNTGRRFGKSVLAINETFKKALEKKGRYWIIAPTYRQVKSIYWNSLLRENIPEELIKKKNESELYIELKNGSFIEFKGADDPDKLRGAGLDGCILDEYAFMKPIVWEEHIQPMIRESGGWATLISTPDGFNHFFDLKEFANNKKNKDWAYFHFKSSDNPYFPKKEIEKAREETSPDKFAQEYMGDFTKKSGMVFDEFSTNIHVLEDAPKIDQGMVHYRSIDFGQANPTAVLWIAVNKDGDMLVYDEIYQKNLLTSELAHLIKAKSPYYITMTYGDSAAAQSIKDLTEHGIYVMPVKKTAHAAKEDYMKGGIEKIKELLRVQRGTGKPRLMIASHCQNLIDEMMNYTWEEEKADKNAPERPQKVRDHAVDALRYFIYEYTRPIVRKNTVYTPTDSMTAY